MPGATVMEVESPLAITLIWNVPEGVALICADFTGPFASEGSTYLKPSVLIADQPELGSTKHCVCVPPSTIWRLNVAPVPFVTGLPTTVFEPFCAL